MVLLSYQIYLFPPAMNQIRSFKYLFYLLFHWPLGFFCALFLSLPVHGAQILDFDDAIAKVVSVLTTIRHQANNEVAISATDFYDLESRLSLPLARHIKDRLTATLQQKGFHIVAPSKQLSTVWETAGQWKTKQQWLSATFSFTPRFKGKRNKTRLVFVKISLSSLSEKWLQPDTPSYARTLVHRLVLGKHIASPQSIYLRPIRLQGIIASMPLTNYFQRWLRDAITESSLLMPADPSGELAQLPTPKIRTRGIRPQIKSGMSLTADLLASQTELASQITMQQTGALNITAKLINNHGQNLASSQITLPIALLPGYLQNGVLVSKEMLDIVPGRYNPELQLEMTTTRGQGVVVYRNGEKIQFVLRVSQSAYIYIFSFSEQGEASLLYPAFGQKSIKLNKSRLLILPDDALPYEFIVAAPFGTESVWGVASTAPLDIPQVLDGVWQPAAALRKHVRLMVKTQNTHFAETEVVIVTKK